MVPGSLGGRGLQSSCEAHWLKVVPHCLLIASTANEIHNNQAGLRPELASPGRSNTHKPFSFSQNRAERDARHQLQLGLHCIFKRPFIELAALNSQNPMSRVGPGPSVVNASLAFCVLRTSSETAIEVAQLVIFAVATRLPSHKACSHHLAERTSTGLYRSACGPQSQ